MIAYQTRIFMVRYSYEWAVTALIYFKFKCILIDSVTRNPASIGIVRNFHLTRSTIRGLLTRTVVFSYKIPIFF